MKHILSVLLSLLFVSASLILTSASSHGYSVKGIATDSAGTGEPYATMHYFLMPDTLKPVTTGITGENGSFSVQLPETGTYRMILSSVGRRPLVKEFTINISQPTVDLGPMVLGIDNVLDEVVVTATKPLISREIDRIGYDVENDPESKTSQLDEMLKKVPMVSVDPDGTIKIKGSTGFKIYKNGRPNTAFTNNAKEIFKSIPASMIKKIEVITDPGSREDAEGTSLILNIVTIENVSIKGVMGNIGLDMSQTNNFPNPNVWLMSQINKVTFSIWGNMWSQPSRSNLSRSDSKTIYDDSNNISQQKTSQRNSSNSVNVGTELSWEIDSLNLVTAEFWGWFHRSRSRSHTEYTMTTGDNAPIYSYESTSITSPSTNHWLGGTASYQHLTRRKGEKFIISYNISGNGSSRRSLENYSDMINMPVNYTGIHSDSKATFLEQIVQADWSRPFTDRHTLDIGAKYIHRDNHSRSDQTYVGSHDYHNDFSHITQVGAVYADYRLNISRWGLRAGVRYEYSRLSAEYRDESNPSFHSELNDIVPNAAVSVNINDRNSMRISYSGSINRPGINYLNPTVNRNPQSISQGNPDLSSIRNHSINYNYSFFGPKLSIDFNAGYTFANNAIIETRQLLENDIIFSTYENAGRNHTFSSNIWINLQAGAKTRIMCNAGLNYMHTSNPSLNLRMGAWNPNCYLRFSQELPFSLSCSVYGGYWGGNKSLYSIWEPIGMSAFYHGITLSRGFLKEKRLNVQLRISNPIGNGRYSYRYRVCNVPYQSITNSMSDNSRMFSINISYRFGSLNAQVKKVRSVESGDVVGGPSRQ